MHFQEYNQQKPIRLSEQRKQLELLSMVKVMPACPELRDFKFGPSPHNGNHEALLVSTQTTIEGQRYPMLLAMLTAANYPNHPPIALLIQPDVSELISKRIFIHTYREHGVKSMDGKVICGHLHNQWIAQSTLGQYYCSVISPWVNNFACFLHFGPDQWPAGKWFTGTERNRA